MASESSGVGCLWQPPGKGDFPRELRYIFVQMLFSLTAAEIARELAGLALDPPSFALDKWPGYAHLILAATVVVTSWVGWSSSEANRQVEPAVSSFSVPFFVLLTDVALVVLYFILVRGAEVPKDGKVPTPSGTVETATIAWIFGGYLFWDFLTKAVVRPKDKEAAPGFYRRVYTGPMWRRGWRISGVCLLIALAVWFFLSAVSSVIGVVLVDAALLFLVLLFRALKEVREIKIEATAEERLSIDKANRLRRVFAILFAAAVIVTCAASRCCQ
jgi:hypothetical protein